MIYTANELFAVFLCTLDPREPLGAVYSEINRQLMFELGYR